MRKLRLDLDALEVETFEPRPEGGDPRGTVFGRYVTTAETCSMSANNDCDLPDDSVTADVYNEGCNTIGCNGGSSFGPGAGCTNSAPC